MLETTLTLNIETDGERTRVALPKQFQDDSLAAFRQAVLGLETLSLLVNAAAVEKIGAAGAQILLAAHRHLEQRGARMLVMDPSPALQGAMDDMGLGAELRGMKG